MFSSLFLWTIFHLTKEWLFLFFFFFLDIIIIFCKCLHVKLVHLADTHVKTIHWHHLKFNSHSMKRLRERFFFFTSFFSKFATTNKQRLHNSFVTFILFFIVKYIQNVCLYEKYPCIFFLNKFYILPSLAYRKLFMLWEYCCNLL